MERDEAILAGIAGGGADGKILTFITRRVGVVRLYYRRFPRRARMEFLDPLRQGELVFSPPTESSAGRMHSFHCRRTWPGLRRDFDRLVCALHLADTAAHAAGEGEPAVEIYDLLDAFLGKLERGGDPADLRVLFDLRLLQAAGYALGLERCVACRREVGGRDAAFSPREGGILCEECLTSRPGAVRRLSGGALSFLRRAQNIPLQNAGRLRLGAATRREVLPLVEEVLETHFERRSPTALFLKRVREARRF